MSGKRSIQPVLNALMVFEEAARLSSFTLAGKSLGMAQPSVSRFVANLEDQTGVQLFTRHHNRVALTEAGEKLHQATTLGLGHIRTVLDDLSSGVLENVLTLRCTHGFAHMWVLPRIDDLKQRLPGWDIRITTTDYTEGFSADGNHLDIRFGDGRWADGEAIQLFEEEVFLVCSPELAARHGLLDPNISLLAVSRLPLIVQDVGEHGWMSWPGVFDSQNMVIESPSHTNSINNYAFALQAAMEGKGIALAWQHLIEPYLSNGWLVKLPMPPIKSGKGYYVFLEPNHPAANEVRSWVGDTR